MKKRVLAVLCTVLICFSCLVLPAMAVSPFVSAGARYAVAWVANHILADIDNAAWNLVKEIFNEVKPSKVTEADKLAILGIWDDAIADSGIDESTFRTLIGGITSEEYYWMFADCNRPIDDICDYVYRTSEYSGDAFAVVKTFAEDSGFTEDDLRTFHELVYVHRTDIYDFTSNTMRYGISIDDICDFCFNDAGEATDNPDTSVNDDGYVQISGEKFADICERLQNQYAPDDHGDIDILSWRHDTYLNGLTNYGSMLGFFQAGSFCNNTDWDEVYMIPFYFDGSEYYYSHYQLHYWQETYDGALVLANEYWDVFENGAMSSPYYMTSFPLANYRYIGIGWHNGDGGYPYYYAPVNLRWHTTYQEYIDYSGCNNIKYGNDITTKPHFYRFWKSDSSAYIDPENLFNYSMFDNVPSPWNKKATDSTSVDIGYICSNNPINMYFEPIPVADDDVITLSGDTIYDYTITNTQGDSTTINNYITNNYTIPETPKDETTEDTAEAPEDSGGSVGGDVNVSGDVDVSGDIEVGGQVDININVNSGSSGSSDVPSSMPVEVDLIDYLEKAPEQAKPITQFFEVFFYFLPPELLALICLGVVVAILLRIWGR